jgi:hypothetical protein
MKNYLSFYFKSFSAPTLRADGSIARDKNGATVYGTVTADECFDIARRMSGGDIYSLPWSYDFDRDQGQGYLCLLDPNDTTRDSKKISNLSAAALKKMIRTAEVESRCAVFGTGKCRKELDVCNDCYFNGSDKCRDCKKRCEQCQSQITRVVSYDKTFRNDRDDGMESRFEPDAGTDLQRDAEDEDCLQNLFTAFAKIDAKKSRIYLSHKRGASERFLAEQYGYKSKTSIARIVAEVDAFLRSTPALKDYFE